MAETTKPSRNGPATFPPFAALRAFEAVFRLGGIRKAAEDLGLNHSVVSRHIRQLEAWMGGALVLRGNNRLTLTEAGELFHARISAAISGIAMAADEFAGRHRTAPLQLWCVPGLSSQWLSREIADFERRHDGRRVELKPTETRANFAIHEADADIHYYRGKSKLPSTPHGTAYFELARPDVRPVASPELARSLSARIHRSDPLDLPLLHEENDEEWRAWLLGNGIDAPAKLPGIKCWHAHLLVAAAREGRGVALASRMLVERDVEQGRLVPLDWPGTAAMPLGAYVLTAREDRWSDPAISALRNALRASAERYLKWS